MLSKLDKCNFSYAGTFLGDVHAHQDVDMAARALACRDFPDADDDANLFVYRASRDEPYGV